MFIVVIVLLNVVNHC